MTPTFLSLAADYITLLTQSFWRWKKESTYKFVFVFKQSYACFKMPQVTQKVHLLAQEFRPLTFQKNSYIG